MSEKLTILQAKYIGLTNRYAKTVKDGDKGLKFKPATMTELKAVLEKQGVEVDDDLKGDDLKDFIATHLK